jgi:subtilisin family serine protease
LQVEWIAPSEAQATSYENYDTVMNDDGTEILRGQLNSLGADEWRKAGFDGKGLRIAIFDVGFINADNVPAFDQIRKEHRVIATRDFTRRGTSENVYYGGSHGTEVWSCIAGKINDKQIGLATGAEFLLAKTEKKSEKYSEELNWLAAVEWADKNGADIINSSLGYTGKRYFNWQMDGHTSFVTRAANIAARKGILVVTAAGNEGDNSWHFIGAPADADSALSVGGIDPYSGYHMNFSSFGPTSDKRLKPNVVAYAHVTAAAPSGLTSTQGTSFSSPLVAGFAACAWQSNRSLTNMQLFNKIEQSGSLYPYFDYAHGYGIPQAGYFCNKDPEPVVPTFNIIEKGDSISIIINNFNESKTGKSVVYGSENQISPQKEPDFNKEYLYYNIMNKAGIIDSYYVVDVAQPDVLTILRNDFTEGETLNVHYKGYTFSLKL